MRRSGELYRHRNSSLLRCCLGRGNSGALAPPTLIYDVQISRTKKKREASESDLKVRGWNTTWICHSSSRISMTSRKRGALPTGTVQSVSQTLWCTKRPKTQLCPGEPTYKVEPLTSIIFWKQTPLDRFHCCVAPGIIHYLKWPLFPFSRYITLRHLWVVAQLAAEGLGTARAKSFCKCLCPLWLHSSVWWNTRIHYRQNDQ